ncbi:hypothetical protein HY523_01045 [Candidatus Berkelbacteria bacterium]|nr:hypothetical protein [Candidatus Berkelbacteria bacterium]
MGTSTSTNQEVCPYTRDLVADCQCTVCVGKRQQQPFRFRRQTSQQPRLAAATQQPKP